MENSKTESQNNKKNLDQMQNNLSRSSSSETEELLDVGEVSVLNHSIRQSEDSSVSIAASKPGQATSPTSKQHLSLCKSKPRRVSPNKQSAKELDKQIQQPFDHLKSNSKSSSSETEELLDIGETPALSTPVCLNAASKSRQKNSLASSSSSNKKQPSPSKLKARSISPNKQSTKNCSVMNRVESSSSETEELLDIGETPLICKKTQSTPHPSSSSTVTQSNTSTNSPFNAKNQQPCTSPANDKLNSSKTRASLKTPKSTTSVQIAENNKTEEVSNISDDEDDSDLDVDLVQLSRSCAGTSSASTTGTPVVHEVTLSDEDEEINSIDTDANTSSSSNDTSRYGFRKRAAPVNYAELNGNNEEDEPLKKAKTSERDSLDICSTPEKKLLQYAKNPTLIEESTKWSLNVSQAPPQGSVLLQLFQKCGHQVEQLFYLKPKSVNFEYKLTPLLELTPILAKFNYCYDSPEDVLAVLRSIKSCTAKGHLKSLNCLTLKSLNEGILKKDHIEALIETKIQFERLDLGDALWEDIRPDLFEKFLETQKNFLQSLTIHGGFKGDSDKSRFIITFPKMSNLKSLYICPKYGFISERKNPLSKKARIVRLDKVVEEPFRFAIQFQSDMSKLEKLVLGNLVEIEELPFSILRKLKVFKCGSYWNLSVKFPPEASRQALLGSAITELQLPDALKDPSFIPKVAKFFPNLKKVWIFLPSVPVLRAFFKSMENSQLEELYLKTQFDFESTMESCLLPNESGHFKISPLTTTQVNTLKEYKHFDEYVRYYNIELPLEPGDLMEGHSAGIRALKSLKVLEIEHIPRILLIPNPEDERKWFDYNCKFLNSTFGYELYPFSGKCHKEILKMNLDKYNWKNFKICLGATNQFDEAGYITVSEYEIHRSQQLEDEDDDDLFIPVTKKSSVNVNIQPSMLLPDYFKDKQEC